MKPDLTQIFKYNGDPIDVQWFDAKDGRIPDVAPQVWQTVKIFARYNNRLVLACNPTNKNQLYEIPGGHVESGETVEQAMHREFKEETNGEIVAWRALGYQINRNRRTGETVFQLRVFANVNGVQRHVNDPGGGVTGTILIDPAKLSRYLDWGTVGRRITAMIRDEFNAAP